MLPFGPRIGKYELKEILGEGSAGIVLRAHDAELQREVAIKVLRRTEGTTASHVQRFIREARLAANLRHPNIVGVHDMGSEGDIHYIVMEYVAGRPLDQLIAGRRLTVRQAVEIVAKASRAVHFAHQQGIIHRDLKPANILIDEAGQPMVTDFGLAKALESDADLTRSGTSLGTPYYMSPEQAAGRVRDIDARSDVFSLGVILYEATSGHVPFPGATVMDICARIVADDPPSPSAVSPAVPRDLGTVVLKALRKENELRYASAEELAEDLDRFLRGERVAARPAGRFYRARRFLRRRPAVVAAAATAVLAATLVGAAALVSGARSREAQRRAARGVELEAARVDRQRALDASLYALWDEARSSMMNTYRARSLTAGECAAFRERMDGHLDRLEQAARTHPDLNTTLARYFRARILLERMDYGEGMAEAERAIRAEEEARGPNAGRYRVLLAEACLEQAIHLLRERDERKRLVARARSVLAGTAGERSVRDLAEAIELTIADRYDEAADLLERLYERERQPEILYGAGDICLAGAVHDPGRARPRLLRALKLLSALLAELPYYAKALLARAHASVLLERPAAAVEDATRVLELLPDVTTALVLRAGARNLLGEVQQAVEDCDAALARDPGDISAYAERAIARTMLDQHEAALADADKMTELEPRTAEGLITRAEILLQMQQADGADAAIERAAEVEPDHPSLVALRVTIALARQDPAGALPLCDAWVAREPESATALASRALALVALGRPDDASRDADRAVELSPELPPAHLARGLVLMARQDRAGARAALRRCADHPKFREIIAALLKQLGD